MGDNKVEEIACSSNENKECESEVMLEDSDPKPTLPGGTESNVSNDLNVPAPEVIMLDSDQSDNEVEEIVYENNECEPEVMLKDSNSKPTLPGNAGSKSFGGNVCASSKTAIFLQQITGEGKRARGVCILCNDSSKTVAKTNYAKTSEIFTYPKRLVHDAIKSLA